MNIKLLHFCKLVKYKMNDDFFYMNIYIGLIMVIIIICIII